MVMTDGEAAYRAQHLLRINHDDQRRFGRIKDYLDGSSTLTWLTAGAPPEIQALARISNVNMMPFVVDSEVQNLFVDDFIVPDDPSGSGRIREAWKRNRMNAMQLGLHRSTIGYGLGYEIITDGDTSPLMRPVSPRRIYPAYGENAFWPEFALEHRKDGSWRLYDDTEVLDMERDGTTGSFRVVRRSQHRMGVCPVVRFYPKIDLDSDYTGIVEPLFNFQDQLNVTTFLLRVAEHFGAHGQKYIIGWMMEDPKKRARLSASSLLSIPKSPGDVEVGQFDQTDLAPYTESRQDTLRLMATVSGTSTAEMLGNMVNLAAETIEAANAAQQRKFGERKLALGESHEQALSLVGTRLGVPENPFSRVIWKDTNSSITNLDRTARALSVMANELNVPAVELWKMLPGVDRETLNRWTGDNDQATTNGGLEMLTSDLDERSTTIENVAESSGTQA